MFVIKDSASGIYFARHNKIITFEDPNLAADFANAFLQYSMKRMVNENPFGIMQVQLLSQTLEVIENDFNIDNIETIDFWELKNEVK